MVYVVRYLLEGDGTIPKFVENGGYFQVGHELVGVSVDNSKRHLPSTVHILTKVELLARVESILNPESEYTAEEIVDSFLQNAGIPDYV